MHNTATDTAYIFLWQITTDVTAWLSTYKPSIARPDMYNQLAELTDVSQSGVFNYIITNQTDSIKSPSVTCKDWLDDQPNSVGMHHCILPF